MKKFTMILLLMPIFSFAGGESLQSARLPKDKKHYQKQKDGNSKKKSTVKEAQKEQTVEKQSKNRLVALFKCCCCVKVEEN